MASIDNKIVNLYFNNAEFERNIGTSINSLARLEDSLRLDGIEKSIQGLSTKTDLSNVERALDSITDRFSTMGIIGMEVIGKLTNGVFKMGEKLWSASFGQMMSGGKQRALNFEAADFQLMGLLNDRGKVDSIMDSANRAVDGTAYGLDAAAVAASQLSASLGDEGIPEMYTHLRAIAGVAAMTNSSFEDTARIFTTVAGNGRLMGMQLTQMGSRGMNAAAVLAKQMGVSEEAVRSMTSKGEISFEQFSNAMYDAFGEHAGKANETFTGAFSNMKAALSRMGVSFFQPWLESMRLVSIAARGVIDRIHDLLKPTVIPAFEKGLTFLTEKLVAFLDSLQFDNFGESMGNAFNILKTTLVDVFTILKNVFKMGGGVFKILGPIVPIVTTLIKGFTDVLIGFGNATTKSELFQKIVETITKMLEKLTEVVKKFFGKFSKNDTSDLDDVKDKTEKLIPSLNIMDGLSKAMDLVKRGLENIKPILSKTIDLTKSALTAIKDFVVGVFQKLGTSEGLDMINKGILGIILWRLQDFLKIANTKFSADGFFGGFLSKLQNLKNIDTGIGSVFKSIGDGIKSLTASKDSGSLLNIAISLGILAASILLLSNVPIEKAAGALVALASALGGLIGAFKIMGTIGSKGLTKSSIAVTIMAIGIGILSTALKKISDVDPLSLAASVTALMTALYLIVMSMSKLPNEKGILKASAGMILIGLALGTVTKSIQRLSEINATSLIKGLGAMAIALGEILLFTKFMTKDKGFFTASAGLLLIGTAIGSIAKAFERLAKLSLEQILSGLVGFYTALLGVVAFTSQLDGGKGMMKAGASLILIGIGMNVIAGAIKKIGDIPVDKLMIGLLGLSGALLAVFIFMKGVSTMGAKSTQLLSLSVTLVAMGVAVKMLSDALKKMSEIPASSLIKSILGLGGALLIIGTALYFMSGTIVGSIALGIAALAILGLASAISILSLLPADAVLTTIKNLGIALLGLTVLSVPLGVVSPLLLAAALGLWAFSKALNVFGKALMVGSTGLGALLLVLSQAVSLFETTVTTVLGLIVHTLETIPVVFTLFIDMLYSFVSDLRFKGLEILESIMVILTGMMDILIEYTPILVGQLLELWTGMLNTIAEKLPEFIDAAFNLIVSFISGLADAVDEYSEEIGKAVAKLISAIIKAFFSFTLSFYETAVDLIFEFIKGLGSLFQSAKDKGGEIVDGVVKGLGSGVSGAWEVGRNVITGFLNGIGSLASNLASKAWNMGAEFLKNFKKPLDVRSPSRKAFGVGVNFVVGFINGIDKLTNAAIKSALGLGSSIMDGFDDSISNDDFMPHITPILDFNQLQTKIKDMDLDLDVNVKNAKELEGLEIKDRITMTHKFEDLRVVGVNDDNEFVESADYAVEDILAKIVRRQSRV